MLLKVHEAQVGQHEAEKDESDFESPDGHRAGKDDADPTSELSTLRSQDIASDLSAVKRQDGEEVDDRPKEVNPQHVVRQQATRRGARGNDLNEKKRGDTEGETRCWAGSADEDVLFAREGCSGKDGETSHSMELNRGRRAVAFADECVPKFVNKDGKEHGNHPKHDPGQVGGRLHPNATPQEKTGQPEEPVDDNRKAEKSKSKHIVGGRGMGGAKCRLFRLVRVAEPSSLDGVA